MRVWTDDALLQLIKFVEAIISLVRSNLPYMIIKIINPPNPFARKPGDNRASERMRIACIRLLERCATEIEIICTRNKKLSIL